MVFAKSEEQETTAEEDVEDTGRVILLNHLDVIGIFRKSKLNLYLLYHHVYTIIYIWQITLVPQSVIQIELSSFYSVHFLGLNW